MTHGEPTDPASSRRPSYGRPAPEGEAGYRGQEPWGAAPSDPWAQSGGVGASQQGPFAPHPADQGLFGSRPTEQGPFGGYAPGEPGQGGSGPAGYPGAGGATTPVRGRRRGLKSLIIGLVLFVLVGPAVVIGGLVIALSGFVSDVTEPPTAIGAEVSVDVPANQMLLIYTPVADAGASCTASGAVSVVSDDTDVVTLPDGNAYTQQGILTTADTTVTITCTGTDDAGYLGPIGVLSFMGGLAIGPLIGFVVGLVGFVLTIVGIVRLVRSRRA